MALRYHIMLWAAACVGFFRFLRAGEFTVPTPHAYDPEVHHNMSDLALDNHTAPSMACLCIKQSKTDPFRQGVEVFLCKTGQEAGERWVSGGTLVYHRHDRCVVTETADLFPCPIGPPQAYCHNNGYQLFGGYCNCRPVLQPLELKPQIGVHCSAAPSP